MQLRGKSADAVRSGATKLATPTGTRIAGLGAPAAFAAGSLMQGDVLGAAGELGGGIAWCRVGWRHCKQGSSW
jgi:hypothetical protein